MTEKATTLKGQIGMEHTRLQEWAFTCFTTVEETNETLHSALGSSGSLLGDRKGTLVIYPVNICMIVLLRCSCELLLSWELFLSWELVAQCTFTAALEGGLLLSTKINEKWEVQRLRVRRPVALLSSETAAWRQHREYIKHHSWPAHFLGSLSMHTPSDFFSLSLLKGQS